MLKKIRYTPDGIAFFMTSDYPGRPTMIFLHDSLGCTDMWGDFPTELGVSAKCNVIVYDRRGYGRSRPFPCTRRDRGYMELEADELRGLMEYWALDDAILFGHSDGGSIALITGAKYPAKISAIITEGAHIFVEEETVKGIMGAMERYVEGDLRSRLERYHGDKTHEMFRAWADTWTSEWFRGWNIGGFLPAVTCPSLIIQGEVDEYGTLAQVGETVAGTKGPSSGLIIPGVKHSPHREAPARVIQAVSRFIGQVLGDD